MTAVYITPKHIRRAHFSRHLSALMNNSVQQKLSDLGLGTTHTTVANVLLENNLLKSPAPGRAESAQ